eukprot:11450766-Ditylum_brightwellii.AAC.1
MQQCIPLLSWDPPRIHFASWRCFCNPLRHRDRWLWKICGFISTVTWFVFGFVESSDYAFEFKAKAKDMSFALEVKL